MIDFSDLHDVVVDFAEATPLSVTRATERQIVNGRPVDGPRVAVEGVVGSCWQVTGRRVQTYIDLGRQSGGFIDVYVATGELQIDDDRTATPGDLIVHGGLTYRVFEARPWPRGGFYHYVAEQVKL